MWIRITDDYGDVVSEGNEGHFSDCFFSNVSEENITDWVNEQNLFVEFSSFTE